MRLAVVIPAFNEARTIRGVVIGALRESPIVVVVDDASTDGTSQALSGLPARVVRHETNLGKAAALWTGFDVAMAEGADYVATLDGDGQHDPADLRRLVNAAARYPRAIVIGARLLDRASAPPSRRVANRIADFWISWAAGYPIADSQSGERLYPSSLLRVIEGTQDRGASFTFESEILIRGARIGFTSVAVPIRSIYPPGGRRSHFRPVRDIARIVSMVARALLARGLYLPGLWNSLRAAPLVVECADSSDDALKIVA
jgi:glycosyltransferase involved in cell wall biosynthesis